MDMLRQIAARLEVVEATQRRGVHLEDVSDDEEVAPNYNLEPEVEQDEEMLLRFLFGVNSRLAVEVACYDGKLETDVVLDWISKMDNFFEYENTPDNQKVKIAVTKLKGHTSLCWDHLQIERQKGEKKDQDLDKDDW